MNSLITFIIFNEDNGVDHKVCLHPAVDNDGKLLQLKVNLRYTEYTIKHTNYACIQNKKKKKRRRKELDRQSN